MSNKNIDIPIHIPISISIPNYQIEGNILIYYRAIYNRPVEILMIRQVPLQPDTDFRRSLRRMDNFYEGATEIIPEFMDLQKIIREKHEIISDTEFHETFVKMNSFLVHIALWDVKTRSILTIHLFEYPILFSEHFDMSKESAVKDELYRKIIEKLK